MSAKKRSGSAVLFFVLFAFAITFIVFIIVFANVMGNMSDDSQSRDYGVVVTDMQVNTVWNNDRSCHVEQKIFVEFQDYRHGIYVDIPVNSGERVRDLVVDVTDYRNRYVPYELSHEAGNRILRVKIGDADYEYSPDDTMVCELRYNYLTPEHPEGKNLLDINAIGKGWACEIHRATVNVTFPTALNAGDISAWIGNKEIKANSSFTDEIDLGEDLEDKVIVQVNTSKLSSDGKTITLQTNYLGYYKGIRVKATVPAGTLVSGGFEGIWTIVIGNVIMTVVILLMLFVGKDKPITPVVGFYPPMTDGKQGRKRRMLPVQIGKIIDGKCSKDDVTSLIFYWASQGFLTINDIDGKMYFIKQCDIDPVTEYERDMFNELFRKGERNKKTGEIRVKLSSLSGNFAETITKVEAKVNSEYLGKFYKPAYTTLSVCVMMLVALLAVFTAVFATLRISSWFFNFWGLIVVIPVLLAYGLGRSFINVYFKLPDTKRLLYLMLFFGVTILTCIALMFVVPTHAMGWTEKIVFAVCVGVSAALSPFLTRRQDEYTEMLNDIIGFRNFLRDAEKDRLEALLEESPQYYYDILPYANVLGVSDIWQDKFKDLKLEPPTYYYSSNINLFDLYVIARLTRSVGSSLTYVTPPNASRGSLSGWSSGGGHSSGGGGSFGGFGGGGGGSW